MPSLLKHVAHTCCVPCLPQVVYSRNGVKVTATPVDHYLTGGPVAYRLEWQGLSFTYSGRGAAQQDRQYSCGHMQYSWQYKQCNWQRLSFTYSADSSSGSTSNDLHECSCRSSSLQAVLYMAVLSRRPSLLTGPAPPCTSNTFFSTRRCAAQVIRGPPTRWLSWLLAVTCSSCRTWGPLRTWHASALRASC